MTAKLQLSPADRIRCDEVLLEGLRRGQRKDLEGATGCFSRVIEIDPHSADGHYNLGVSLRGLQRLPEAVAAFQNAVRLRPEWAEAFFNLGNGLRDLGDREGSIRSFEQAIQLRPTYVKALNNAANLYLEQGHLTRAEELLRRAIAAKPDYGDGMFNLGRVLRRQRRLREALELTAQASKLQPTNLRYQLKLAELQRQTNQPRLAKQSLEQVLRISPYHPDASFQLAALLRDQGQLPDGLAILDRLVMQKQVTVDILILRADFRRQLNQLDDALDDLRYAIELDPHSVSAHNMHGVVLLALGDAESAIQSYDRALALRPDLSEAHSNRGAALQALCRYAESLAAFDTAIALKPDFAVAHLNRSLSILRDGRFEEGWREFEWRFLCPDYRLASLGRPAWAGERLDGKTILLRSEQGLGDTIQFIRYATLIKQRGARVVVEAQDAVGELVASCPGVDQVVKRGAPLPHIDVQTPLMSLPRIFGTTLPTIPATTPYLSARPELVAAWRQKLRSPGKLLVGIAWQGNKKFQGDRLRSLPLAEFRPLSAIPEVALVSLQRNEGTEQLFSGLDFRVQEYTGELDATGPFRDTAAIITACDLVVTSDTAIAHLAGALGKPVWVALSYSSDWRWLIASDTCPWYPTMRVFRQTAFKDWPGVFSRIASELRQVVAGDRDRLLPSLPSPAVNELRAEITPGELIDKITILTIKSERLDDAAKLANVHRELDSLQKTSREFIASSPQLRELAHNLKHVNEQLWDIEDDIRRCERDQDFGPRFTALARSIYIQNDRRASLKREVNNLLHARFCEEKSYCDYRYQAEPSMPARKSQSLPALRSLPTTMNSAEWSHYLQEARTQAIALTHASVGSSRDNDKTNAHGIGVVIGHFDSIDFLNLNLKLLRKHCGAFPLLVSDDCSPGWNLNGSCTPAIDEVLAENNAVAWTNQNRLGHVSGDLSALAKGILWAKAQDLEYLVKMSQRFIVDRPNWLAETVDFLRRTNAITLGRGCKDFGWKIRTELMAIRVEDWHQDRILKSLLSPPDRPFAELIAWELIEKCLSGRLTQWDLLAPGRQSKAPDIYFRATHRSEDFARLAQSVGITNGTYRCAASEVQANYQH